MRLFKYNVFCILSLISTISVCGQKSNSIQRPIITLLGENYFRCKGCELRNPKVFKKQIDSEISKDSLLDQAAEKIKQYFTSEGDHFILLSKKPNIRPKTTGFLVTGSAAKATDRGFGTYIDLRHGGNSKGSEVFYKVNDLLNYITDSLLVFDSLELSTASILDKSQISLGSLRASYQFKGVDIEREIPYDEQKEVFTLSYKVLFGSKLSRSITDTIPVKLSYYSGENEKIIVPGTMKIFFTSSDEKEDMTNLFGLYKKAFPDWTTEEIADELFVKITAKYKNASMLNFIEWLRKIK